MLKTIIVTQRYGQLCNCVYRLGNLIAFAKEHRLNVVDFSFAMPDYGALFDGTSAEGPAVFPRGLSLEQALGEYENAFPVHNFEGARHLDIGALNAAGKPTARVEGFHLYASDCVEKHRRSVTNFFRPNAACRQRVDTAFESIRSQADRVVGAHIRLSDFRQWKGGRFFFEPSVYANYMRQVQELFSGQRVRFIVFSDERIDPAVFEGLNVVVSHGSAIEDLYSLSRCDLILGTAWSTFSGWAAFSGQVPLHRVMEPDRALTLDDFQPLKNLECIVRDRAGNPV